MPNANDAIIIFVRKPELGKVKTRLAAAIGKEAALAVYQKLIVHTHSITSDLPCNKYVFYVDAVEEDDLWRCGYRKLVQMNTDLGGRMKAAFELLFQNGYSRICIIGSDCFELTTEIIQQAFTLLHHHQVIIGPAKDGGYYLLGMSGGLKDIFDGIEWSTERVLEQTKAKMEQHHYTYALLPFLTDVDTVEDLPPQLLAEL